LSLRNAFASKWSRRRAIRCPSETSTSSCAPRRRRELARPPEERASFLSILDPDIEWVVRGGPPDLKGHFRGIDAARDYYPRWAAAWAEWDWEIEEALASGDLVVTRTRVTGRGRESGVPIDMRIGQVRRLRDGKVVSYEAMESWEAALAVAGLEA
jgi:ketosteroid isomerase-like protein